MRVSNNYNSIICFGDSLTQQGSRSGGFVTSLQEAYIRRLDVINRGYSGYTSRQGLALCPILFERDTNPISQARLATVWLGTNDAIEPGFSQHVPLQEYKSNMTSILQNHFNSLPVLLITPTTVINGMFEGHKDDSNHERYGQALQEIANELNQNRKEAEKIIVIDMRKAFLQAANVQEGGLKALMDADGLHLAIPGYKVVFDAVMAAIETYFPHLIPEKLKYVIPDWKDLDLALDQEGQKKQLLQ